MKASSQRDCIGIGIHYHKIFIFNILCYFAEYLTVHLKTPHTLQTTKSSRYNIEK